MENVLRGLTPARIFAKPAAESLWLGPAQRSALSHLVNSQSIRILAGPESSGRSSLLEYLQLELADRALCLRVAGPQQNAQSVLTSLLVSAELSPWELSDVEQRNLLSVLIQQRIGSAPAHVILTVDDPEQFTPEAWEEIERIHGLDFNEQKAVELVVAVASAATAIPVYSEFLAGSARLSSTHELAWLKPDEVAAYIDWRLERFDLAGIFTPTAVQLIARCTQGRFRAIDLLCQMTLLLLRQAEKPQVDAQMVQQATNVLARRHRLGVNDLGSATTAARDPDRPRAELVVTNSGTLIDRVELKERMLLGRSEHNDLCLPSPYLGRHHAVIIGTPSGYYIVDLNSVNGTYVNGKRIGRSVLHDEDLVSLGRFRLKVRFSGLQTSDDPLPGNDSLTDTANMPAPVALRPNVRIIEK